MDHALSTEQGGTLGGIDHVPALALCLAGPPLIALCVAGVRWLRSGAGREHRWVLAAAAVAVVSVMLVTTTVPEDTVSAGDWPMIVVVPP